MSNETSSPAHGRELSPEPNRTHDGSGAGRSTLSGQGYDPADNAVSKETRRRVIAASFIGNFVEWFDYAVYGYLAVTIATVFFPESDPQTGLLLTFALFAISFLVRPARRLRLGPHRRQGGPADSTFPVHPDHVRGDVLHRTDPGLRHDRHLGARSCS